MHAAPFTLHHVLPHIRVVPSYPLWPPGGACHKAGDVLSSKGAHDWEVGWGPGKRMRASLTICSPARPRDGRAHGRRQTPVPGATS